MTERRPERFSRGGCWSRPRSGVRIARRIVEDPDDRFESRGIRLVEVVDDPASTPTASESIRVYRGGIWDDPQHARMVYRGIGTFSFGLSYNIGIRLVEEVDE